MKRVELVAVLLVAGAAVSCTKATEPVAQISASVVRVQPTTPGSLDVQLEAELTNLTSNEIRLVPCALSLERQAGSEWEGVWSPACALANLDPGLVIPPMNSRTLPLRIRVEASGSSWPSDGLDGTYRLRFHFFPSDEQIRYMSCVTNGIAATPVVSNEFTFPGT